MNQPDDIVLQFKQQLAQFLTPEDIEQVDVWIEHGQVAWTAPEPIRKRIMHDFYQVDD